MFPEVGDARVTGPPVKLSGTPVAASYPAPKLGADTRSVLAEVLHLDDKALDALTKSGTLLDQ
jgi:crotonobetainyl-CoA:carnitine CoA-transferase CaiB-like acyl-CoA transferase